MRALLLALAVATLALSLAPAPAQAYVCPALQLPSDPVGFADCATACARGGLDAFLQTKDPTALFDHVCPQ